MSRMGVVAFVPMSKRPGKRTYVVALLLKIIFEIGKLGFSKANDIVTRFGNRTTPI